jgi:3-hydroxybutyryl-CoA dehydrogenase
MPADMSAVVVGTGRMAPGIAAALAQAGARVTVAGRSLDRAVRTAELAGVGVTARALEPGAFRDAWLVVETVTEDVEIKTQVYALVTPWLGGDTVLATNTSGLSISALGRGLPRPEAFAGLHFLYPADITAVVEIIAGEATADETVDALSELAARMGKAPIVARRDVPGFVWNRLQHALLREALWLVDQQVADIATVDAAVSDGLAPRWLAAGPFATVDLGGMDTWSRVATEIFPHLASDPGLAAALGEHEQAGTTFYEWDASAQPDVSELRSQAIRASRDVTAARRRLTPAARSGGTPRDPARGRAQPEDLAAARDALAGPATAPADGQVPLTRHAAALRSIADALDAQHLPEEIARTSGQLRLLAARYEDAAVATQLGLPRESGQP